MTTRRVVLIAMVGALYVVLTVGIAPFSFGPVQFRVSEVLKVLVLFDPFLVLGIGVGTLLANLWSPFVGPWELIWMPLTDMAGGLLAWWSYRTLHKMALSCSIYAITTALSVALMLWVLGIDLFWLSVLTVGASELAILIGGIPLMRQAKPWVCPS
jgi:uncharacterized membrane protein